MLSISPNVGIFNVETNPIQYPIKVRLHARNVNDATYCECDYVDSVTMCDYVDSAQ